MNVDQRGAAVPDVSVIVPVFNTMPYLTECLRSLEQQTLGLGAVQVIAVNDGSTDAGPAELERFAAEHPNSVVVRHQSNSGGPANPCNEGLALATGRYVFFLGSDDHLAPDALERLVTRADEWGSDVIFGTMVGVNDRYVDQRIYAEEASDLSFETHPLAYSLSNTKLFRRSLVEERGIRYPEDLRVGSDQLFVVATILQASRVSVLVGDPFYFAVKRDDRSNITYASTWASRLRDITTIMDRIAAMVEPGEIRDSILRRHFHFELGSLLKRDFPGLDGQERDELLAGYRLLAERYLTDGVADRLPVLHRVPAMLAVAHDDETLLAATQFDGDRQPALVLRDGQAYADLPGFGRHPDAWYRRNPGGILDHLEAATTVADMRLVNGSVLVRGTTSIEVVDAEQMFVALTRVREDHEVLPARRIDTRRQKSRRLHPVRMGSAGPAGTQWQAEVPLPIVDEMPAEGLVWEARLRFTVDRWTYDLPIDLPETSDRARSREHLSWQTIRLEGRAEGYVRISQRAGLKAL